MFLIEPRHRATIAWCGALTLLTLAATGLAVRAQSTTATPRTNRQHVAELTRQISGRETDPAEQVFKNIQVFAGMPARRVLLIMEQAFSPNLGVECAHCHVDGDWASDAKPAKTIARAMWTLRADTQAAVREATGNPEAVVTCYTCHKGQPKPAFAPGR